MISFSLNMTSTELMDAEAVDRILEGDPAGAYSEMDPATRERYWQACLELAAWSKRAPTEVAHEAIQLCQRHDASDERGRHVGVWLLAEGRAQLEVRLGCRVPGVERAARMVRRYMLGVYLGTIAVLMLLLLGGVWWLLPRQGVEPLSRALFLVVLALPIFRCVLDTLETVLLFFKGSPARLPSLDPARVLRRDTRTIVVTPLLITRAEDIEEQLRALEINYLGNVSPELFFALLTDFRDAPAKEMPGEGALLDQLERGIRELNERHGHREQPRFFFFHRERRWNPVTGRWMGWERKRGKLEEFNRVVLGASDTSYIGALPDVVRTFRYVITLDADNRLVPGSAAQLVAMLHHPLNRARFDATGQRVIAGYSIIQPTMVDRPSRELWLALGPWPVSIARRRKDGHQQLQATSSLSQILFGVGDYIGKGIYDVAAFARSLEGRVPDNLLLSHDRFEGMYARVAFAEDILMLEGRAADIVSTSRIWHRWWRGDWQLLPWLFPWVPSREGRLVRNSLSLLNRWKLFATICWIANAPVTLLALAYGWLWLPASYSWAWTLIAILWLCGKPIVSFTARAIRTMLSQGSLSARLRAVAASVPQTLGNALMSVAPLVPTSGIALDAMARGTYRLAVNRRQILDWTTHAQAVRQAQGLSVFALPEMRASLLLTLIIGGAIAGFNPGALPWALPVLLAWLPLVERIRRDQAGPSAVSTVAPRELEWLRALARRSWALYEQLDATGREPPRSSLSEEGVDCGVPELSPTDLALWLVAPLSAYHLGYLTLEELVSRLGESLSVVAGLERHGGHLFERYDARELRPLGSRRVSEAESGMLAAVLIIIESGLRRARTAPASPQVLREGLIDTLVVLCEELEAEPPSERREQLTGVLAAVRAKVADRAVPLEEVLAELRRQPADLGARAVPVWWERLVRQLERASRSVEAADAVSLVARLDELEARARLLRDEMRFTVLSEAGARTPGSAPHGGRTTGALLAGFVAISRKEAPLQHWLGLIAPDESRLSGGDAVERSSLAESLLPGLFLWFPPTTLLQDAALAAVDADIARGAVHGIPWGVEAAPRGTPGVGSESSFTVMPHLSLLALRFRPEQAIKNLRRMVDLGARGSYGLFDAIQVRTASESMEVRRTFTCQHQAMTLAAVANLACDDILVQLFHRHWQTGWVEDLVYETGAVT